MIVGIGTDIIEIERIKKAVEKKNSSFIKRIFSNQEIQYFEKNKCKPETIAGSFAAKEAVMKTFGTGLRGFRFKDIEILRDESGKPFVDLSHNAALIAKDKNIKIIQLSISHCREYAIAYATAEDKEV